jgi:hypothetical protein
MKEGEGEGPPGPPNLGSGLHLEINALRLWPTVYALLGSSRQTVCIYMACQPKQAHNLKESTKPYLLSHINPIIARSHCTSARFLHPASSATVSMIHRHLFDICHPCLSNHPSCVPGCPPLLSGAAKPHHVCR